LAPRPFAQPYLVRLQQLAVRLWLFNALPPVSTVRGHIFYLPKVQPKQGTALVFFPSAGGLPNAPFDVRTLHAGLPVDTEVRARFSSFRRLYNQSVFFFRSKHLQWLFKKHYT
jgi:hypothetical protein